MDTTFPQRLVVLGLDGLPFTLAQQLCAAGHTPHLARLIASPHAIAIEAELPELSPVNWTSFYTGLPPEEHGVFGFTRINASNYALSLTDFSQVRVPTIFDKLGERGLTSRVINLPNTYPARPIAGMLISGFVAHDLAKAVYPPFLMGPLLGAGYQLEADTVRGASDPQYLLAELTKTLQSRRAALHLLWHDKAWNLFVFVLTETDRLFHFLWDAVTDSTHPLHRSCMELLTMWDILLGEVLDLTQNLPQPTRLIALADHGFTALRTEVDINAWLRAEGFLHLVPPAQATSRTLYGAQHKATPDKREKLCGAQQGATPDKQGLDGGAELDISRMTAQSVAFALDPGRIYLHRRQRFAKGCLSDSEANALIPRLQEHLMRLEYHGHRVFKNILTAEECYKGSMRAFAPDLLCVPNEGFDLKAKWNRTALFGHFGRTGTHTVCDTFFYDSYGSTPQRVHHVGQEVLRHFAIEPTQTTPTGLIL